MDIHMWRKMNRANSAIFEGGGPDSSESNTPCKGCGARRESASFNACIKPCSVGETDVANISWILGRPPGGATISATDIVERRRLSTGSAIASVTQRRASKAVCCDDRPFERQTRTAAAAGETSAASTIRPTTALTKSGCEGNERMVSAIGDAQRLRGSSKASMMHPRVVEEVVGSDSAEWRTPRYVRAHWKAELMDGTKRSSSF
mmetsp:Transcript_23048/g.63073  ORF Transcript_23048/g.63073 Transcript_23048/m.63073 type:complete len:205 (+) Transcript_23048:996-1610(+)